MSWRGPWDGGLPDSLGPLRQEWVGNPVQEGPQFILGEQQGKLRHRVTLSNAGL